MKTDYQGLFGRMCAFREEEPLLLFSIPELAADRFHRFVYSNAPVELVVPDLDAFCIPEEDLERIQWAVDAAFDFD